MSTRAAPRIHWNRGCGMRIESHRRRVVFPKRGLSLKRTRMPCFGRSIPSRLFCSKGRLRQKMQAGLNLNWLRPFNRASQLVREGGMEHMVVRALGKLTAPALEMGALIFFRRDLEEPGPEPRTIEGITFRVASIADAPLLARGDPASEATVRERLNRGDVCFFAADSRQQVAHYRWATRLPTHLPELNRYFRPGPSEVYLYDLFTFPEYRRLGVDTQCRVLMYSELKRMNARAAYCYVRAGNPAGLRAARRWHQEIGRVWYLRIRGLPTILRGAERLPQIGKS